MKSNRVLMLIGKSGYLASETSLLEKLGYEVFCPDIDTHPLSIPQKVQKRLIKDDFYSIPWSRRMIKDINNHFSIALISDNEKLSKNAIQYFSGRILIRFIDNVSQPNYKNWDKSFLGYARKNNRIHFAPAFPSFLEKAPAVIKKRSLELSVGITEEIYAQSNTWNPDSGNVIFACSNLEDSVIFKDFKYLYGRSLKGVECSTIIGKKHHRLGLESEDKILNQLRNSKVLFFADRSMFKIYPVVLNAMAVGIPVLFLSGGLLEYYAREAGIKEPILNCCDSIDIAKEKIQMILDGDEKFINQIQISQKKIVEKFNPETVLGSWRNCFIKLMEKDPMTIIKKPRDPKKEDQAQLVIGIWMHMTMKGGFFAEGISRFLGNLLVNYSHSNIRFKIACVSWVKEDIISIINDMGGDGDSFDFVLVSEKSPFIYQFYQSYYARKMRRLSVISRLSILTRLLAWIKSTRGATKINEKIKSLEHQLLGARGIKSILFLISFGLIAFPILILIFIYKFIVKTVNIINSIMPIRRFRNWLSRNISRFKNIIDSIIQTVYGHMVEAELEQLLNKVNNDKEINGWLLPYPGNKSASRFLKPTITIIPDIVYLDFPIPFIKEEEGIVKLQPIIYNAIKASNKLITYSEVVKQRHIVRKGYKDPEDVFVIPHAPIQTKTLLTSWSWMSKAALKDHSNTIIHTYLDGVLKEKDRKMWMYLKDINFADIDYIFVSSQRRPHKNYLNLVKVFETLLREKFFQTKLIVTGNFSDEINTFVNSRGLHLDVLSLHGLPAKVHAAVYACAKLVVAPTLFEGGFPFVFSEGLSVDTPVLLSRIPVVEELLSEKELDIITFDPYNNQDILKRIEWALKNHIELLAIEKEIYLRMSSRTWSDVTNEYIQVMKSSFGNPKKE